MRVDNRVFREPAGRTFYTMIIVPGQEGIVLSLARISIHGDEYVDVVIADPAAPDDPERRIAARLGPEAIAGSPGLGDRVRIEGVLGTVLRIERVG
jgi:hypothetical protein